MIDAGEEVIRGMSGLAIVLLQKRLERLGILPAIAKNGHGGQRLLLPGTNGCDAADSA